MTLNAIPGPIRFWWKHATSGALRQYKCVALAQDDWSVSWTPLLRVAGTAALPSILLSWFGHVATPLYASLIGVGSFYAVSILRSAYLDYASAEVGRRSLIEVQAGTTNRIAAVRDRCAELCHRGPLAIFTDDLLVEAVRAVESLCPATLASADVSRILVSAGVSGSTLLASRESPEIDPDYEALRRLVHALERAALPGAVTHTAATTA